MASLYPISRFLPVFNYVKPRFADRVPVMVLLADIRQEGSVNNPQVWRKKDVLKLLEGEILVTPWGTMGMSDRYAWGIEPRNERETSWEVA